SSPIRGSRNWRAMGLNAAAQSVAAVTVVPPWASTGPASSTSTGIRSSINRRILCDRLEHFPAAEHQVAEAAFTIAPEQFPSIATRLGQKQGRRSPEPVLIQKIPASGPVIPSGTATSRSDLSCGMPIALTLQAVTSFLALSDANTRI